MSAPEPVAAPAAAPAPAAAAAVSFDNAKVDELKSQATDKVQELYKKGKDKLDQVNCQPISRSVVAVPARDPAREDANLKPDIISPPSPLFRSTSASEVTPGLTSSSARSVPERAAITKIYKRRRLSLCDAADAVDPPQRLTPTVIDPPF